MSKNRILSYIAQIVCACIYRYHEYARYLPQKKIIKNIKSK